jgi:hypothetical protein
MYSFNGRTLLYLNLFIVCIVALESQIHTINVGKGGNHAFDPEVTYAHAGDLVVFRFFPTNHSVVRGEYVDSPACKGGCNPCIPYELIHSDEPGFHSGNVLTQTLPSNESVCSHMKNAREELSLRSRVQLSTLL